MFEEIVSEYGSETVVNCLSPMLTERRMARIEEVLDKRLMRLQVGIESPTDPHNALAVVRTAEGMGLYRVHLITTEFRKRRRTTCGSNRWIDLKNHKTLDGFIEQMDGVQLIGACPRGEMRLEDVPIDRPVCLLFGNEYRGISDKAREACSGFFQIPMYGMVESYNLSVSAALSMQSVMGRMRQEVEGDLSEMERKKARAIYYLRTIGVDTAKLVLQKSAR